MWHLFWLVCTVSLLSAQTLHFETIPEATVTSRLQRTALTNPERRTLLHTLFDEAGCREPDLEDQKAKGSKLPNIVCTLGGESSDDIILVTAHYDKVAAGAGAIDNWTGASLLPSLFEGMSLTQGRRHRLVFIGFTDEEAGLAGSRAWVDAHKKTIIGNIRAVVNIDSVAAGPLPLYVWATRADPDLAKAAYRLGAALKIPIAGMSADAVGDSDSTPFRMRKVPVIDFHSLNDGNIGLLHSKEDQMTAVNMDSYRSTYRFLAAYITYIDGLLAIKAPTGSPNGALN